VNPSARASILNPYDIADTATLAVDLRIAQDYERYLDNREAINALIAANAVAAARYGEHP
jgi:hypothetical protein